MSRRAPSDSDLAVAIVCPTCAAAVGDLCLKTRGVGRIPEGLPAPRMASSHPARVFDAQLARRKKESR